MPRFLLASLLLALALPAYGQANKRVTLGAGGSPVTGCQGAECPFPEWLGVPDHTMTTEQSYDVSPYCIGESPRTFSLVSGGEGVVAVSAAGVVTAGTAGTYESVTVRCTNAHGLADETWALTVTSVAPPPTGESLMAVLDTDPAIGSSVTTSGYWPQSTFGGATYSVVNDEGLVPDFGSVHLLTVDLEPEVCETTTFTEAQGRREYTLTGLAAGEMVDPFSFRLTLTGTDLDAQPYEKTFTGWMMHGAANDAKDTRFPLFRFDTGFFREHRAQGGVVLNALANELGAGWSVSAEFCYRKTASGRRLLLTGDANGVALGDIRLAEYYGVTTHADSAYFDNTDALNWALHDQRESESDLSTLELGQAADYYYMGTLRAAPRADSTVLRGQGGTELVTRVDDFGNTFHPVENLAPATRLLVLPPDTAPAGCEMCDDPSNWWRSLEYARGHARYQEPSLKTLLGYGMVQFEPENHANRLVIEDILADGAFEEWRPLTFDNFGYEGVDTFIRNKPGWSFVSIGNEGGLDREGFNLTIRRSGIENFPATNVLGDENATCTFHTLRLGSAPPNHSLYGLCKLDAQNYTQVGQAWGHSVTYAADTLHNYVAYQLTPSYRGRTGSANEILSVRGGQNSATCEEEFIEGRAFCGVTVDGFYLDMRGVNDSLLVTEPGPGNIDWTRSGKSNTMDGTGPSIHLLNGVIVADTMASVALWGESGNGAQDARYADFEYGNVQFFLPPGYRAEGDGGDLIGNLHLEDGYIHDIQVEYADDSRSHGRLISLTHSNRDRPEGASGPIRTVFQRIGSAENPIRLSQWTADLSPSGSSYMQFFMDQVYVDASSPIFFKGPNGQGDITTQTAGYVSNIDSTRVYWIDSEIEIGSNQHNNATIGLAASHFLRVTDRNTGAVSEETVSYTCDGSETTALLVPTNLLAIGHPDYQLVDYSATDAGLLAKITSTNWADASGDLLDYTTGGNLQKPRLEVHLSSACSAGEVFRADLAVSQWLDPDGDPVTLPLYAQ